MLRTIIAPIDGSQHAQLALELAADIASKYQARLIVIHVSVGDETVPDDLYNAASKELLDLEREGKEMRIPTHRSHYLRVLGYLGQRLLADAKDLAAEIGVKDVDTVTTLGAAGEQIIQHAKDLSADLIVMGSRGFSQLKGLVLGSVSQKVHQFAPCPCLTVSRKGGERGRLKVERILAPTDGSEIADRAVEVASDIASKVGAKLVLQYVMWRGPLLEQFRAVVDMSSLSQKAQDELDSDQHPIAEHVSNTLFPPVVSKETLLEIGNHVLERSRKVAQKKNVAEIDQVLLNGDPARKIVQAAKSEKIDLIVMGSRGLGASTGIFDGSVSYKVSHSSPTSCMVVR